MPYWSSLHLDGTPESEVIVPGPTVHANCRKPSPSLTGFCAESRTAYHLTNYCRSGGALNRDNPKRFRRALRRSYNVAGCRSWNCITVPGVIANVSGMSILRLAGTGELPVETCSFSPRRCGHSPKREGQFHRQRIVFARNWNETLRFFQMLCFHFRRLRIPYRVLSEFRFETSACHGLRAKAADSAYGHVLSGRS